MREGEGVEGPSPALGVRKALRGSWRRYCVGVWTLSSHSRRGLRGFVASLSSPMLLVGSVILEKGRPHISAGRRRSPGISLVFADGAGGGSFCGHTFQIEAPC